MDLDVPFRASAAVAAGAVTRGRLHGPGFRRMAIVAAGLPAPVLQHPVGVYRLDMAYPGVRLGMEYDGVAHRTQERAMREDLDRQAELSTAGWTVLRFRDRDVRGRPGVVGARVRRELVRIARRTGVPPDALNLP